MDRKVKKVLTTTMMMVVPVIGTMAADIIGKVTDAKSKEALIGATVQVDGTDFIAATDIDGNFKLTGLDSNAKYSLTIKYVAYENKKIDGVLASDQPQMISVALTPEEQTLGEVTVTGIARRNTETAMVQVAKNSPVIVNNVSAQEIGKTQDTNAGEVIRRVPGVSLIDDKFVMVRGLSQRYNNVWINGGAAPSSEADSRAFSFDLIPSAQIDNMQIVKTPSPEYPADYTGGFIVVFNYPAGDTLVENYPNADFVFITGSVCCVSGMVSGVSGCGILDVDFSVAWNVYEVLGSGTCGTFS